MDYQWWAAQRDRTAQSCNFTSSGSCPKPPEAVSAAEYPLPPRLPARTVLRSAVASGVGEVGLCLAPLAPLPGPLNFVLRAQASTDFDSCLFKKRQPPCGPRSRDRLSINCAIICVTCLWRTDGQSFILRTRGRGASKRPVLRWHLRPVTRRGEPQMTARFRCSTFRGCARASWLRHRFPSSRSVPH